MRSLPRLVREHPAVSLFLLAVALGTAPLAIVETGLLPPGFIQLGALSASAAGFILAGVTEGRAGVRALLRRALIWRVGLGWWAVALLLPGVITVVTLFVAAALGGPPADLGNVGSPLSLLSLLVFLVVFAGVGEEFGWRGFALPRVQSRISAFRATLLIGVLHALWHVPLFFIPGVTQYEMVQQVGFVPFLLGSTVMVVAGAIQMTWIFNNTGGSVLLVAVFHGAGNAWNGYFDIYRGQMTGPLTYTGLLVVVSIALVLGFGPENLSRRGRRIQAEPPDAAG